MSLYVCEKCKAVENTALGQYWGHDVKLCSECGRGQWHGRFPKEYFSKEKWQYINDHYIERK